MQGRLAAQLTKDKVHFAGDSRMTQCDGESFRGPLIRRRYALAREDGGELGGETAPFVRITRSSAFTSLEKVTRPLPPNLPFQIGKLSVWKLNRTGAA